MNKKLRNILTLSLALLSTVSFAQDWNLESRTRANMNGDNSMMLVEQRATLSSTVGGDNWGVHLSTDVNYMHHGGEASLSVYEAYANADLFGFANLTVGRQAWDFGSGAILGSNQWAADRTTRDGMLIGVNNDFVDLDLGYSSLNFGGDGEESTSYTVLNASKSMGDFSANLLVVGQTSEAGDDVASGLDVGYSAMGGKLDLTLGVNAWQFGEGTENEMSSLGATYNVSDNLSVSASQTTYGADNDTYLLGSNMGYSNGDDSDSWLSHGNLGYLNDDDVDLAIGVDYSTGAFDLSYTMHTLTNNSNSDYEKSASELSVGYSLNDNASLSLKWATDDRFNDDGDDYMWLSLSVTP